MIHNNDGTITYNAIQWGGLVADFTNQDEPENWSKFEKIVFEFAERTAVRTQVMFNGKIVSYGSPGIALLSAPLVGIDVKDVKQVALQAYENTTIKVKRMTLMSGDNALNVVKTVRATVNIGATDGTQSPISGDDAHKIQLSTETLGQPEPPTELFANETAPLELTTTERSVQAFFAASSIERFILETTYDVYDATGTVLIREDQTAQNIFSVSGQALESGQQSSFIITVDPTYLYVLADPDLDSPTFTLQ